MKPKLRQVYFLEELGLHFSPKFYCILRDIFFSSWPASPLPAFVPAPSQRDPAAMAMKWWCCGGSSADMAKELRRRGSCGGLAIDDVGGIDGSLPS